jgi:hypothetical protein
MYTPTAAAADAAALAVGTVAVVDSCAKPRPTVGYCCCCCYCGRRRYCLLLLQEQLLLLQLLLLLLLLLLRSHCAFGASCFTPRRASHVGSLVPWAQIAVLHVFKASPEPCNSNITDDK